MEITYSDARNPKYVDADETIIDLEVNFDHLDEEWVWFTADPNDFYAHSADILARAIAGDFGTVEPYTPPA